ncbi:MAG: class II fumarate hydratase [Acidobacteriota bacterium]|nr:class II fumarate hydratase [Acidobacteriota bacterium]MDH3784278.1 class II fumarate hydratase [Acidobacteriota bacterium]
MSGTRTRTERDSMGEMEVPVDAYYGASTQRAVLNFPISGRRLSRRMIQALGLIKWAAADTNSELGRLDGKLAAAIGEAALEVADGKLDDEFVVDIFQTGSGTSSNMNANEVIANRAAELLGGTRGSRDLVHPNDHVNMGQSSNDVIPTMLHLSAMLAIEEVLRPGLETLQQTLDAKSTEFWDTIKTGRTHLQDATPIRMGQVFRGFAGQVERGLRRTQLATEELSEVAQGGTAVGTGLNTHPEFSKRLCAQIATRTGLPVRETENHFQAQQTLDAALTASGNLRTVAVSLHKIANDIRLLASGPRTGLGELRMTEVQPGSSIMPGKVNPVIAESLIQVTAQVIANDQALVQAAQGSYFELNTMQPFAADNLIQSIEWLGAAALNFSERCVAGLECTNVGPEMVERGLAIVTRLVPVIGYDLSAKIAHVAADSGRTVREVAEELTDLTPEQLDEGLDPFAMTHPE